MASLRFSYLEHLGAAGRTGTLGSRSLILHDNGLGILHLFLGMTLNAVRLHVVDLLFAMNDKLCCH
jgi:hypothetical protein